MGIDILKVRDQETKEWKKIPAIKGDKGDPGEQGPAGPKGANGDDGIYVGTSEPTDSTIKIWLNPDGEVSDQPIASLSQLGLVKPDGTTITISDDGTISLAVANFEGSTF